MLYSVEKYRRGAHLPFPGLQPVEKWATNLYCSVNTGTCACELVFCTGPACAHSQSQCCVYSTGIRTRNPGLFRHETSWRRKWCFGKDKASSYSIIERRVSELISVFGSQLAGDVSHKPGGRLPLLSARPATNAWWTEAQWVWTVCLPDNVVAAITRPFCAWVQHTNHLATEPPGGLVSRPIAATCNGIAAMPRDRQ